MKRIELVPYSKFAKLRLEHFFPEGSPLLEELTLLENWEYLGGVWEGHAIGFSEFLYLESLPHELGSLALSAEELPPDVISAALSELGLPVASGMTVSDLEAICGKPDKKYHFTDDRVTYEYLLGQASRYVVSFTVLEVKGLTYITVAREDILALITNDA